MNANSLSSASKVAASSLSSANSQAGNPASKVSETLASGSAAASSYAKGIAGDGTSTAKTTGGIFALFSTFNLVIVTIALGAAYYNGYLDGVIAYIQNLLSDANDQKERVLKENTGHTSVRAAAKEGIDATTAKARETTNQMYANANPNASTQQRTGYVMPNENASPLLSQQTTQ